MTRASSLRLTTRSARQQALRALLALAATAGLPASAQVRVRNGGFEAPLAPIQSPLSVASFYGYNTVNASSADTGLETPDVSILFLFQQTAGPLSLVVVHDQPNGIHPPHDATFVFRNLPATTSYALQDDPGGDTFTPIAGGQTTASWTWQPCCTDGAALTNLDPDPFCIAIDPTFDGGILGWQAISGPNLPGTRSSLPDLQATTWICKDCQVLTCPAVVSAECTGGRSALVAVSASGSSLCGGPVVVNDRTAGGADATDTYPVGTTTVTFTLTDAAGFASTCATDVVVEDTQPPVVTSCPAPLELPCTGAPIPVSDPTVQAWIATFTASDACGAVTLTNDAPPFFDLSCPPLPVLVTFTATDEAGHSVSTCQATVTVRDTTAPVVTAGQQDLACTWPPNHKYVCFTRADFDPAIADGCSGVLSWVFAGCASDQCDDAPCAGHPGENGDGNTANDCVVSADGQGICVRSERAGSGPRAQAGRHYAVAVVATDGCGNASSPAVVIGSIHVPHDQSPHERTCRRP